MAGHPPIRKIRVARTRHKGNLTVRVGRGLEVSLLKPAPKPRRSKVWLLLLGVVPPFVSALVILFTGARLARFARFDSEWDKLLIGVVTGVIAGIVGSVVMGRMRSRNSSGLFQP